MVYLLVKSAFVLNKPDKIYIHCNEIPTGDYWEQVKGFETINLVEIPSEVFGNPITELPHAADIIRLNVLSNYGGIYLDLDTICVRPFPEQLFNKRCVMGLEKRPGYSLNGFLISVSSLLLKGRMKSAIGRIVKHRKFKYVGLCNAVIMAEPGSRFIKKWIESYTAFNAENWNYNSVIYPFKVLLPKYRFGHVKVLNHRYFFYPSYDSEGLKSLFEEGYNHEMDYPDAIVHHLWATTAGEYLINLTEEKICKSNSYYANMAKRFLDCKSNQ